MSYAATDDEFSDEHKKIILKEIILVKQEEDTLMLKCTICVNDKLLLILGMSVWVR